VGHGTSRSPLSVRHPALDAPVFGFGEIALQLLARALGFADETVALVGLPVLDLAVGGELEALLRARLGLHLGHFALLLGSGMADGPGCIKGRRGMPRRAAQKKRGL